MKIKKTRKVISLILTLVMTFGIFSVYALTAEARATTYYAYSIGVNHGTVHSGLTGNFVPNVEYAHTCYGMINGISSYFNDKPTVSYMKGNNPAGVRRIASRVVWLNGHANHTTILFNHNNNGGSYDTGVYYGSDTSKYVGIQSTNMSGVDLISFVGCETAKEKTNLASYAYAKGATTAVGFTGKIVSRSTDGQGWCRKFNDALALGHTVSSAITYATSFYPNANLPNYIKVYGSTNNRIASSGNVASITALNYIAGTKVINVNATYKNIGNIHNESLKSYAANFSSILNNIRTYDSNFDINDYKVSANMYSDDGNSGIVIFTYKIGDILTNKAYVATIENGVVTDVICNNVVVKSNSANLSRNKSTASLENSLLKLVADHKRQQSTAMATSNENIIAEEANYIYNYNEETLIYQRCVYTVVPSADNVIVDTIVEEILN